MIKSIKPQDIICSKEEFLQTFESIKRWDSINDESRRKILTWIKYFSKKLNLSLDNFNELELLEKMKSSEDFFDIWLARKIEEILWLDKDLENHYFEALNNSTMLVKVDLEWKIIYVNEEFANISWYTLDELIWKFTKDLSWDFSKERPVEFWTDLWNTVLEWKIWKWNIKNMTKHSDFYRTKTVIVPKMDYDWNIEYFLVVRTDITETENLKEELLTAYKKLKIEYANRISDNAKLANLSLTDELTNLWNKRAFNLKIEEEFDRAKRNSTNLSLLIFDIDFFKNVNDTYWHDIWDLVLKTIWKYVWMTFETSDFKARIWWEEFAIIIPWVTVEKRKTIRENFREVVEWIDIEWIPKITVSIWISCYNLSKEFMTIQTFTKKADDALYLAKNSWRNKVKTCKDL